MRRPVTAYANALERQGRNYTALKGLIECVCGRRVAL